MPDAHIVQLNIRIAEMSHAEHSTQQPLTLIPCCHLCLESQWDNLEPKSAEVIECAKCGYQQDFRFIAALRSVHTKLFGEVEIPTEAIFVECKKDIYDAFINDIDVFHLWQDLLSESGQILQKTKSDSVSTEQPKARIEAASSLATDQAEFLKSQLYCALVWLKNLQRSDGGHDEWMRGRKLYHQRRIYDDRFGPTMLERLEQLVNEWKVWDTVYNEQIESFEGIRQTQKELVTLHLELIQAYKIDNGSNALPLRGKDPIKKAKCAILSFFRSRTRDKKESKEKINQILQDLYDDCLRLDTAYNNARKGSSNVIAAQFLKAEYDSKSIGYQEKAKKSLMEHLPNDPIVLQKGFQHEHIIGASNTIDETLEGLKNEFEDELKQMQNLEDKVKGSYDLVRGVGESHDNSDRDHVPSNLKVQLFGNELRTLNYLWREWARTMGRFLEIKIATAEILEAEYREQWESAFRKQHVVIPDLSNGDLVLRNPLDVPEWYLQFPGSQTPYWSRSGLDCLKEFEHVLRTILEIEYTDSDRISHRTTANADPEIRRRSRSQTHKYSPIRPERRSQSPSGR